MEQPAILCSEVPTELLEASTYDDVEPSPYFRGFLEAGHTRWRLETYGPVPFSKAQMANAVMVLWVRARRLYSSHVLVRDDADWDKPFFSDEGLYG